VTLRRCSRHSTRCGPKAWKRAHTACDRGGERRGWRWGRAPAPPPPCYSARAVAAGRSSLGARRAAPAPPRSAPSPGGRTCTMSACAVNCCRSAPPDVHTALRGGAGRGGLRRGGALAAAAGAGGRAGHGTGPLPPAPAPRTTQRAARGAAHRLPCTATASSVAAAPPGPSWKLSCTTRHRQGSNAACGAPGGGLIPARSDQSPRSAAPRPPPTCSAAHWASSSAVAWSRGAGRAIAAEVAAGAVPSPLVFAGPIMHYSFFATLKPIRPVSTRSEAAPRGPSSSTPASRVSSRRAAACTAQQAWRRRSHRPRAAGRWMRCGPSSR
jgi:hypothetical protein